MSTRRDSIAAHPDQCEEGWDGNLDETPELLDRKKRRVLSIFFGLLLSKSQRMLPFFPIVETLGLWYKGVQQRGSRTITGGLSSTLQTAWKRIDNLYSHCLPTFNKKLRHIPRGHASFDNYNKILSSDMSPKEKQQIFKLELQC